jgi:hypothetical protein
MTLEAAFLHGHRSQVKFEIGGQTHQRELADLLILTSWVDQGRLQWQRACFVQAKKEEQPKRSAGRYSVDEWQLALLRNFPKFEGVTGLFQGTTHELRNHSGMLGAYGFLSAPGEFSVTSARIVGQLLGGRKSIQSKDLAPVLSIPDQVPLVSPLSGPWSWPCSGLDPENCSKCRVLLEQYLGVQWEQFLLHRHRTAHHAWSHLSGLRATPAPSVLSCMGLDGLVSAWTTLRLGELIDLQSNSRAGVQLACCVLAAVQKVNNRKGGLKLVRDLMVKAEIQKNMDGGEEIEPDSNIAILSLVAEAAQPRND